MVLYHVFPNQIADVAPSDNSITQRHLDLSVRRTLATD